MRTLNLLILFFCHSLFANLYAKEGIKEKLRGEWLCTKITDSHNNRIYDNGYLRFTFVKNSLFISAAPFENGMYYRVKYKNQSFEANNGSHEFQEFFINKCSADSISLTTQPKPGIVINYYFVNQKLFNTDSIGDNERRVYNMAIVIFDKNPAFSKLAKHNKFQSPASHGLVYLIPKTDNSYLQSAVFNKLPFCGFAEYFNYYFKTNWANGIDSLDNELILDLDIGNQTIENIKVVNNVTFELSGNVFGILKYSQRFWRLPEKMKMGSFVKVRFAFKVIQGKQIPRPPAALHRSDQHIPIEIIN
jgi:hypothetical protein